MKIQIFPVPEFKHQQHPEMVRIVLRAGEMARPQALHCFWVEKSTLPGARAEKAVFHHRPQGALQPLPNRHRETVFCTRKNTRR